MPSGPDPWRPTRDEISIGYSLSSGGQDPLPTFIVGGPPGERERRMEAYRGHIFVLHPRPKMAALAAFARELTEEAFRPRGLDPEHAQDRLVVEEFAAIVGALKTRFTNHYHTKELIRDVLVEAGCNLEQTYFDVPRLRVVSHGGYLTAGVGYAYRPHRDTWYSATAAQINWWSPVYPLTSERTLALFPAYFDRPLKNTSATFDYAN
jgi:hypothetical protein